MSDDFDVEPLYESIEKADEAAKVGGVQMEPTWECPDCEGGFIEEPRRFQRHLMIDHGFSREESRQYL